MTIKYKDYILAGTPSEIKTFIELVEQKPTLSNTNPLPNDIDDTMSRINSIDRYNLPETDNYYPTLIPKEYFMKDDNVTATFNYIEKFLNELEAKHNSENKTQSEPIKK